MKASQIIDAIRRGSGRRAGDVSDEELLSVMNLAQKDEELALRLPALDAEPFHITLSAGRERYPLPLNYKSHLLVWRVDNGATVFLNLLPDLRTYLRHYNPEVAQQGTPTVYLINDQSLVVAPRPDASLSLWLSYRKYLEEFVDVDSQNWLSDAHPQVLVASSLFQLFAESGEDVQAAKWKAQRDALALKMSVQESLKLPTGARLIARPVHV